MNLPSPLRSLLKRLPPLLPTGLQYYGRPHSVMIETNANCNLRCPLCPVHELTRPTGKMTLAQFQEIADDLCGFTSKLLLWNYGEPFLHPDLFAMIGYAKKMGFKVIVSTNSTRLGPEYRDQVLSSDLDELIVCLDGFSPETQESYRVGSHFTEIRDNIEALCQERRERNQTHPRLRLQFVVMRQNEHEVGAVRDFAARIGIDEVDIKTVNLWLEGEQARDFVPKTGPSRYDLDAGGRPVVRKREPVCTWWLRSGVILCNGDVSICCYDHDGKYTAGNVFRDGGFRRIYQGTRWRKLRRAIVRHQLPICRDCQASTDIRSGTAL